MTGRTALTGPAWSRLLDGRDLWRWVAVALFLALGIGLRSPWPADEPRFALAALDMIHQGHWLLPHRGGEVYADKPPLFMWLQALFYFMTGSMKTAFLMPSLVASLLTLGFVFDLVRRLATREQAWIAVLLLLVTVQFTAQAKSAQIDATLSLFTTVGLYGLLRHFCLGPAPRWYAAAWFAMGAGIMTKGVGFLPVLALPGLWAVRVLRARGSPRRPASLLTLSTPLLLFLPALLWLIPLLLRRDDPAIAAYLQDILFRQTVTRYADGLGHYEPFGYYLTRVIPGLWLPISILLPWLVPDWIRQLRRLSAPHWALVGYLLLSLLFFSLSPGKRGVYMLPLLPVAAILAALSWPALANRALPVHILRTLTFAIGLFLLTAASATIVDVGPLSERIARADLPLMAVTALLFVMGTAWVLAATLLRRGGAFPVAIIISWILLCVPGYLLLDPVRSAGELMQITSQHLAPEGELGIVGFREQQLLQADRDVVHWSYHAPVAQQAAAAVAWLRQDDARRVLITETAARSCFRDQPGIELGFRHRREWRLVGVDDVVPGNCNRSTPALRQFTAPHAGYRQAGAR